MIGASGAAVILLAKALARELSREGIRVNAVALTITSNTVGWDRMFATEKFGNKVFAKAVARFPSGRAPTAEKWRRRWHFWRAMRRLKSQGKP